MDIFEKRPLFQETPCLRVAIPAEVLREVFLVKFDLKFAISDGEIKFGAKTFLPANKAFDISSAKWPCRSAQPEFGGEFFDVKFGR